MSFCGFLLIKAIEGMNLMGIYKSGYLIPMTSGGQAKILDELGEGGQGTVYKVEYKGKAYALKWYKKDALRKPDQFYSNLKNNIANPPSSKAFLWPLYLSEKHDGSFGYLMDLRPKQYKDFADFLLAKVHFSGADAALNAALNIVEGFLDLHARGYSYQDLNDGNFFINPVNGDVLICDNDNVSENGENQGIAGKMRYMAPEIVRREANPDLMSDRFSLAIILFMILCLDHPLDGKMTCVPCMTEELEKKCYGLDPVFIFDKNDRRNAAVPGVNTNALMCWPDLPKYIQDAFGEVFSHDAMTNKDRAGRLSERQWQKLLLRAKAELVKCTCGSEQFMYATESSIICSNPKCKKRIEHSGVLHAKYDVILQVDKKLYPYQFNDAMTDYKNPCGLVVSNPKDPRIKGITNCSEEIWTVTAPDGKKQEYPKGRSLLIKAGNTISLFGGKAEIH